MLLNKPINGKIKKKFSFRWLQGVFIMLLFVMIGMALIYTKDIRNQAGQVGDYYKAPVPLIITLEEPLVEKNSSYKALASVNAVEQTHQWKNKKEIFFSMVAGSFYHAIICNDRYGAYLYEGYQKSSRPGRRLL